MSGNMNNIVYVACSIDYIIPLEHYNGIIWEIKLKIN